MKKITLIGVILALILANSAFARGEKGKIKARQGQMWIIALNMGVLGGMAKGEIDYDADAAQRAADSLAALGQIDQTLLWAAGTDADSIEGTEALPAIWSDGSKFMDIWGNFTAAANEMQAVAGTGQDALGPMLGKLGATCKACHSDYRTP